MSAAEMIFATCLLLWNNFVVRTLWNMFLIRVVVKLVTSCMSLIIKWFQSKFGQAAFALYFCPFLTRLNFSLVSWQGLFCYCTSVPLLFFSLFHTFLLSSFLLSWSNDRVCEGSTLYIDSFPFHYCPDDSQYTEGNGLILTQTLALSTSSPPFFTRWQ